MPVTISKDWRVRGESSLAVALPASTLWGQMRDWRRFLTTDPLHERLDDITPGVGDVAGSPRGTTFLIRHRFLCIGPTRRGKILSWREGRGFAISDLSLRGVARGFPHICSYRVEPSGNSSRLVLGVRGTWTARWVPRPLVALWIRWVLLATEARLSRELHAFARWRRSCAVRDPHQ